MLKQVEPLLKLIRAGEANGSYDAIWYGIKAKDKPGRPITQMTVREVLAWQDSIDRLYQSEACGAYQFLEDTLRDIVKASDVRLDDTFGQLAQDKLALVLLKRRGLDDFLSDRLHAIEFAQHLSQEWASLPCSIHDAKGRKSRGQSYYDGDGLNTARVKLEEISAALEAIRTPEADPVPVVTGSASQGIGAALAALFEAILALFARAEVKK